jgi:pimeloyl-ACP methyl ester carboxylesterase
LRVAGEHDGAAGESFGMVPREGGMLALMSQSAGKPPAPLPAWLTEADLDFYVAEFSRTGLRGGLNWYRNIDRNWENQAPFVGAKVSVPALFVAGERDPTLAFPGATEAIADLPRVVPKLRPPVMLPGCGHWTQQERPQAVNTAMLEFLRGLEG